MPDPLLWLCATITLMIVLWTLSYVSRGGREGWIERRLARQWIIHARWSVRCRSNGHIIGTLCVVGEINPLGQRRIRITEQPERHYGKWDHTEIWLKAVEWRDAPQEITDG